MPEDQKKKEAGAKDEEMKDAGAGGKEEKEKEKEKKEPPKDPKTLLIESLGQNLRTISAGVAAGDSRVMGRVVRSFASFRRTMLPEVLKALIDEFVDPSRKAAFLPLVQVDAPMTEEEKGVEIKFPQLAKPYPPEIEVFAVLLLLIKLSTKEDNAKALECAKALLTWLKPINRRTLDMFNSRVYFYYALAHERSGNVAEIRTELLAAYRTACLRHDSMGQATLLNLLLRNFLSYNLYDQALKLVRKTNFPESRPNAQYARYLFYIGQIKAVQLEYSDSHSKLMQAIRKAPQASNAAIGFKLTAHKLAIIVELLMGDIPDRAIFSQKELREKLLPYYAITQAVRSGDLKAFTEAMQKHEVLFKKDKTFTLINRLRYNVIKTGLRSINLSYSRISLQDICLKLGLESPEDAAAIVAKAVVDGVIDATIDHDQQCLISKQRHDIYATCEPQKALHKRIAFCLQMHNDTVKAMAYPDENELKDGEDAEERREREKRELLEVDDDDGDDSMML